MSFRIAKLRGMDLQDYELYKNLVIKFHAEEDESKKQALKIQINDMQAKAKEKFSNARK